MSTKKIVINACYGGFGLSHEAMMRWAQIKGITLHMKPMSFGSQMYATIPWDQMPKEPEHWHEATYEEREAFNAAWKKHHIYDHDIPRDDPALVQVVEEMGAEDAGGSFGHLKVVEIPSNADWKIEEYDGKEWVAEVHRTWS